MGAAAIVFTSWFQVLKKAYNCVQVPHPAPQIVVDLKDENDVFGLAERVVATESSVYISLQLDKLKSYMELHVSQSSWESIAQLIDQVRTKR
jgi:hypothetical protein